MKVKVARLIRKKRAQLAHQLQFKDWISPALHDYWAEFLQRANNIQLLSWIREQQQQLLSEQADTEQGDAEHPDAGPQPPASDSAKLLEELPAEARALLDELQPRLGEETHVGDWLEVNQERINQFAEVTDDRQWLHTDPQRAALESPFKTTIAHGFLTLALLPVLTDSVNPERPQYPRARMAVNYGLNQVRFPYPVKAGSRVRARTRLASVVPIKRGLELVNEITVEVDGSRRPACVAESVLRLYF